MHRTLLWRALALAVALPGCSSDARDEPVAGEAAVPATHDFAGCYAVRTVAVDIDDPHATPLPPDSVPHVFELVAEPHPRLPGYFVLGVVPNADGMAVTAGAWTISGDSAVVVWHTPTLTYAASLLARGDTLRGNGGPVHRTLRPVHALTYTKLACDLVELVPARVPPDVRGNDTRTAGLRRDSPSLRPEPISIGRTASP